MTIAAPTQPAVVQRTHHLLPMASLESLGFDPNRLVQLEQLTESDITQDRCRGSQIAIASPGTLRHGEAGSSHSWPARYSGD